MNRLTEVWDIMIDHAARYNADAPLLTRFKRSGLLPPNQLIYSEDSGYVVAQWTARLGERAFDNLYVTLKKQQGCWRLLAVLESPGCVQGAERFMDLSTLYITLDAWQQYLRNEARLH